MKKIGSIVLVMVLLLGEIIGGHVTIANAGSTTTSTTVEFNEAGWSKADGADVPQGYSNGNLSIDFYKDGNLANLGSVLYCSNGNVGDPSAYLGFVQYAGTNEIRIKSTNGKTFNFNQFVLYSFAEAMNCNSFIVKGYVGGVQVGADQTLSYQNVEGITPYAVGLNDVDEVRISTDDSSEMFMELDSFTYSTTTVTNDAPTISLDTGSAAFTEDGSQVAITSGGTVTDGDSADFNGGYLSVAITGNFHTGEDVLGIDSSGAISVSGAVVSYNSSPIGTVSAYNSATGVLTITLNANSTPANVQELLRNITYKNSNEDAPNIATRTISITLNDGDGGTSTTQTRTVTVSAVNDAPTISITNKTTNILANAGGTITLSGIVDDPDKTSDTVKATLNGVEKSTTVNLASTTAWSLTWNIASDNIAEGNYTNIPITITDTNEETATNTYTGTITVDKTAPTGASISINSGDTYTTSTTLNLTLGASGATKMKIGESSNLSGVTAIDYSTSNNYNVSATDGTKTIYVVYLDAAGNETAPVNDTITLDTQAPTGGSISINSGVAFTNTKNVTISLSAIGAAEMMISEDSSFAGASYETYASSKSFSLSDTDGTKTVYVKYKDAAGNETTAISDTINLATQAPTSGSISINGGDNATNSTIVNLTLFANNATQMMISEDSSFSGASYETYATSKSFSLSALNGTKTVYVKYKDIAENETTETIQDSILLDTMPPTYSSISIDGGATYATSTNVAVALSAMDATQMILSENSSFTGASYETYNTSKTFTLSGGDGAKTIYVKYKDAAGNETTAVSDTITLDTQAPTTNSIEINLGASYTNATSVILTLGSTDAVSMVVSEDSNFTGASYETYDSVKDFTLSGTNGTKTIYAKFKDAAGNESTAVSANIELDTQAPTSGSVSINQNDIYTNSNTVYLTLAATDAAYVIIGTDSTFTGASYETYVTSKTYTMDSTNGSKTIYVKFKDNHGNESSVVSDSIYLDSSYTGIKITPETVSVQKGKTQTFQAVVANLYHLGQDVTWSVSQNNSANTTISSSGVLTVGSDETANTLTIKAVPATSGVTAANTTSAGATVPANTTAAIYGIATVTVTEVPVTNFTISASATPSAGGSVTGASSVASGGSITLTASANSDYSFQNWTENGTIISTDAIFKVSNITQDQTYVANFLSTKTLGDVTERVVTGKNVPTTGITTGSASLISAVFTKEEQQQIQNGASADVLLKISNADSLSATDKTTISGAASGYQMGGYYDVTVWKQVGSSASSAVSTLNTPISFKMTIPTSLLNTNPLIMRNYVVIRLHNGKATVLKDQDSDSTTLTIQSALYSTYVIAYKDTVKESSASASSSTSGTSSSTTSASSSDLDAVPDTGDQTPIIWLFVLAASSGMGAVAFARKKKKEV